MIRILKILLQFGAYGAFMALLGFFATNPPYQYANPTLASIKLSLHHATKRIRPCVALTPEQIAELAANMRRTEACERARLPLVLELDIDGHRKLDVTAQPAGVWHDGPASIYRRFAVSAEKHSITVRLRDSARTTGWDYVGTTEVRLEPGRYLTITFRPADGVFQFR